MAGVDGSLPPAAFYAGPPSLPSSLARHKRITNDPPEVSETPSATPSLTEALIKLTESISAMQTRMASQANINKSVEDKIGQAEQPS